MGSISVNFESIILHAMKVLHIFLEDGCQGIIFRHYNIKCKTRSNILGLSYAHIPSFEILINHDFVFKL